MAQIRLIGTDPSQVPTNGMLGSLAFQSAESVSIEKLVVTSAMGIGIDIPSELLHIHAPTIGLAIIRLSGTAANQVPYNIRQGVVGVSNSGFSIYDVTSNATRICIGSAGNVGIGRTNPAEKLDVDGSIQAYSTTVGSPPYIVLAYDVTPANGAAHGRIAVSKSVQSPYSGKIHLQPQYYDGSAYNYLPNGLVVDASGGVGIGTASPLTKLHINLTGSAVTPIVNVGSFGASGVVSLGSIANNNEKVYLGTGEGSNGGIAAGIGFEREASGWNSALSFYTNNVTLGLNGVSAIQEKMRITSTGNVGIGTTSPDTKLDVWGPIAAAGRGLNVPHVIVKSANGGIRYFEYYFTITKPNNTGQTATVNIISVANLDTFHQAAFTVEYGTRLQGIGTDATTSVCLKQFGVNRFNNGNVAITDTNDIASDTNSNTHANVTCVTNGSSGYVIRVDFSASIAGSSFCSGVVRGWGVSDTIPNITFTAGP